MNFQSVGTFGGKKKSFYTLSQLWCNPTSTRTQVCRISDSYICNSPPHTNNDYQYEAIYRSIYAYRETLIHIYVCRCLKICRHVFHSLHKGDQRKPTEVKEEHLFSNSIITSDTSHSSVCSPSAPLSCQNWHCWTGPGWPKAPEERMEYYRQRSWQSQEQHLVSWLWVCLLTRLLHLPKPG